MRLRLINFESARGHGQHHLWVNPQHFVDSDPHQE
jgi:hypothetical protein